MQALTLHIELFALQRLLLTNKFVVRDMATSEIIGDVENSYVATLLKPFKDGADAIKEIYSSSKEQLFQTIEAASSGTETNNLKGLYYAIVDNDIKLPINVEQYKIKEGYTKYDYVYQFCVSLVVYSYIAEANGYSNFGKTLFEYIFKKVLKLSCMEQILDSGIPNSKVYLKNNIVPPCKFYGVCSKINECASFGCKEHPQDEKGTFYSVDILGLVKPIQDAECTFGQFVDSQDCTYKSQPVVDKPGYRKFTLYKKNTKERYFSFEFKEGCPKQRISSLEGIFYRDGKDIKGVLETSIVEPKRNKTYLVM